MKEKFNRFNRLLFFKKILAATTARKLAVVDVERGEQLLAYENCAYNASGKDRVGVATDPVCPSLAVCVSVNGKGLTLLDLRMPLPLEFFYEVSRSLARNISKTSYLVCMPLKPYFFDILIMQFFMFDMFQFTGT